MSRDLFDTGPDDGLDLHPDDTFFEPTPAAAQARLTAVRPSAYARTRNHLAGAVTRLSPYLTHGLLTPPQVADDLQARFALPANHKLRMELGWRAFFHHRWQHLGAAIFESLHAGPRPDSDYAATLPADVREARSGVPAIDQAVRQLHATGWLHNHARLWLASYVVHVRGVHWRAGADWLYGHLLDGDLASNHLSWQWVAGTGSHQPYLANAENIARHTAGVPALAAWRSEGSVIDTAYELLGDWAHGRAPWPAPSAPAMAGVAEPALRHTLPAEAALSSDADAQAVLQAARAALRPLWLMHPWALAAPPPRADGRAWCVLGLWPGAFLRRWPWSARRIGFVGQRFAAVAEAVVAVDDAHTLAQALADWPAEIAGWDDPHLAECAATPGTPWPLPEALGWRRTPPAWLPEPAKPQRSFSAYWAAVQKLHRR
ncbi:FAD-binding domain-containing protein [Ideonella sp. DXS22W]|uniref:FAD-binding domain-containing protein n=1 Tax=Pseudaquabacterium inlustre TaxID=2984192 RepID=A0ABU9CNC5_9BURK